MNCEKVGLLIEEFYDGELDPRLHSRVTEHLAACPSCAAAAERFVSLDRLLEKSSAPPPASAQLDRGLMEAFRRRNEKASAGPAWWRRVFVGSVSIPKPALAAFPLALAVAALAPGISERMRGAAPGHGPAAVVVATPAPTPAGPTSPPPETIGGATIVEAPAVRERVVTRVVYVERRGGGPAARGRSGGDRRRQVAKDGGSRPAAGGAVEGGEYVTRANLAGFRPVAELKTRILPNR